MERVSRAVEEHPGLGVRAIRAAVPGDDNAKTLALELLATEGFIVVERGGRTHAHRSVRPYREEADHG